MSIEAFENMEFNEQLEFIVHSLYKMQIEVVELADRIVAIQIFDEEFENMVNGVAKSIELKKMVDERIHDVLKGQFIDLCKDVDTPKKIANTLGGLRYIV